MKQYLSLTPERERGHGRAVEWFPPSSPPAITTTASPRFSKKQLFAVVTVLSAAVVLVAVLSYGIKNDGKLGRIGSFQAASIDGQNVVNIFPNDIEADVNLNSLDLGKIYFFYYNSCVPWKVCADIFCYDCILPASATGTGAYMYIHVETEMLTAQSNPSS